MFCGNCGAPLKEGAKFCSKCGAPVKAETLPEVVPAAPVVAQPQVPARRAKRLPVPVWLCGVLAVCALVFGVSQLMRISNEPCDWCGATPTLSYKLQEGGYAHICKSCRSSCMLCGEPADRHYENLLGTMVFVCDDCYQELSELMNQE